MTARRSVLDLKEKCGPRPAVAMRTMPNGQVQVAIMFPGAVEAMNFTRPTRQGAENEMVYQCRRRGYEYTQVWEDLQRIWDEAPGEDEPGEGDPEPEQHRYEVFAWVQVLVEQPEVLEPTRAWALGEALERDLEAYNLDSAAVVFAITATELDDEGDQTGTHLWLHGDREQLEHLHQVALDSGV